MAGSAFSSALVLSVMRNSRKALRWTMALARAGSVMPASSTTMRLSPAFCTSGSSTPNSSMRFRSTVSARSRSRLGSAETCFDWSSSRARCMPPWRSRPRLSGTRVTVVSRMTPSGAALAQRRPSAGRGSRSSRRSAARSRSGGSEWMRTSSGRGLRHEVPAGRRPGRGEHRPRPGTITVQLLLAAPRRRRTAPRPAGAPPTRSAPTRRTDSPSKSNRCASRRAPPVREGRLGPLVHHPAGAAAPPLDPHRVHAVGRQQLLRRHVGQVDRRHAEQAAAPLAVADLPAHLVRPAQHAGPRWRGRRRRPRAGSASWRRAARRQSTTSTTSTSNPRSAPRRRSVSTSPLRPRPKP